MCLAGGSYVLVARVPLMACAEARSPGKRAGCGSVAQSTGGSTPLSSIWKQRSKNQIMGGDQYGTGIDE